MADEPAANGDADLPDASVVLWVLGFAALFVVLSLAIPAGYHFSQPAEHYYSVEEPHVSGAANQTCTFELETVYWHRYGDSMSVETTLLRQQDDGAMKEVQRWVETDYIPPGVNRIQFERTVDEPLEFGTYQFRFDTAFTTPYGWEKTHEVRSEPFLVHHGNDSLPDSGGGVATIQRRDAQRC